MTQLAGHRWLLSCLVLCGAVATLHQPRPAAGALISAAAVAVAGGRRLALLACLVAGFGLVAAAPPSHSHRHPPAQAQR